ncbi:MAG TPA: hypothetical protein PKC43_12640 [Phycisphaerales bacterium]|nr:hypothetical protein [Phycisphaerales bacterium]HMP38280.1 hypothetical protein [Phycisphaerales bacterium]
MRFDRSARTALIVAAAALLASGLGFRAAIGQLNLYLRKEPVQLRLPLATIPPVLTGWRQIGEDKIFSAAIVEELGTEQYLDRVYAHGEGLENALHVHVAYYTGMIDAIPHVPDRCWVAGGLVATTTPRIVPIAIDDSRWRSSDSPPNNATGLPYRKTDAIDPTTGRAVAVHLPIGDFALRAIEFQRKDRPDERLIGGYFFLANGRATASALDVRSLAFQRTDRVAYYCKVQFSMPARADDETRWERFAELSGDFLSAFLPHLMRRLPDWPEVESRAAASASAPQRAG